MLLLVDRPHAPDDNVDGDLERLFAQLRSDLSVVPVVEELVQDRRNLRRHLALVFAPERRGVAARRAPFTVMVFKLS